MVTRGLEGTELFIRDGNGGGKAMKAKKTEKAGSGKSKEVSDKELAELVKMLTEVERVIGVLSRRGINFADFVESYYDPSKGGLPRFRILGEGKEDEIFYDAEKYEKRAEKLKGRDKASVEGEGEDEIVAEELHEVGRINEIDKQLGKQFGLNLRDFLLKPAKAVSGEALPAKFQLIHGEEDKYEVASLGDLCSAIRQIGGKGIEIKRFKGLGEMNAEQLWDTTMNPQTRTLLSVKLHDAGEADRLFSILMGNDVEKRRNFIRDHALEVQNLDI